MPTFTRECGKLSISVHRSISEGRRKPRVHVDTRLLSLLYVRWRRSGAPVCVSHGGCKCEGAVAWECHVCWLQPLWPPSKVLLLGGSGLKQNRVNDHTYCESWPHQSLCREKLPKRILNGTLRGVGACMHFLMRSSHVKCRRVAFCSLWRAFGCSPSFAVIFSSQWCVHPFCRWWNWMSI